MFCGRSSHLPTDIKKKKPELKAEHRDPEHFILTPIPHFHTGQLLFRTAIKTQHEEKKERLPDKLRSVALPKLRLAAETERDRCKSRGLPKGGVASRSLSVRIQQLSHSPSAPPQFALFPPLSLFVSLRSCWVLFRPSWMIKPLCNSAANGALEKQVPSQGGVALQPIFNYNNASLWNRSEPERTPVLQHCQEPESEYSWERLIRLRANTVPWVGTTLHSTLSQSEG
ncbi:hypothetical protein CRENBAI_009303 [Crenichthys baileyi]|uniref:Uncharacterized protein n=1 Tax=Crenichthys baileyi TaxID=28760 RepID=A0AAV9SJ90_9TELE